jgi:hypothetical protein
MQYALSENIMYMLGPVFNQEEQAEETTRGGRNQEVAIYVQCNLGTTASNVHYHDCNAIFKQQFSICHPCTSGPLLLEPCHELM